MKPKAARSLRVVAPADGIIDGLPPLVPPGEYSVRMTHWDALLLFGRQAKVALWFEVCDFGDALGVRLPRWYNVHRVRRAGKYGAFNVGWSSDMVREYAELIGWPSRTDRLPLSRYENLLIVAQVCTVTHSRRQAALPACAQYSVIRRLLRVEAGNATAHLRLRPSPRPMPIPTPTSESPEHAAQRAPDET